MAFNPPRSFRTPTFRSQLSVRRVYETFQPRSEMKETPEAHILQVYLLGFTKDQMKIELLDTSRMLRITGERPIQGNKWRKFDQTYPVPQNSEAEKLEAKFEQGTLILKMQKKLIPQSQVAPKQEVEKSPQDPSNNKANVDETKVEKVQETIPPPQSTKLEESTKDMKSDSPQTQSLEDKTQNDNDTSSQIPKETFRNNSPQKGQQEFEPKPISKDTPKNQIDEKPQKDQEEFEPKTTSIERTKTQIDEKAQKGQEEFEPKTTSIEKTNSQANEKTQKPQEEVEPKPMVRTVTTEKLGEKIVTKSDEDVENEVKEKNEKPYESSNTMKDGKNQNLKENEIEKAEPSTPNVSQKEKESCCRNSPNQEGNMNGIKKLAVASSQFVTRIAEGKLSGEERHLVENVGAAVLVIAAFGAYVSYRFSS
ncbi:inactive protein RESTRICTED TEV MOVEMENT 2-like [Trifolium pratense]|uniref:inactive protein RESTRICTED TEV MOVEMENT 2-like n=1 Tax=Trifolium pratense TaxID=57577 RepID=UPI001E691CDF|nr:inactive protein RESTRICTED TEV MOVEMENT 2-like [Trifolium pratense]